MLVICIVLTCFAIVAAVSDIIVTNDERCTEMGKYYIENFDATPPELAIIISTCEGIVNPQFSGLGGGFIATIFNGDCPIEAESNSTRFLVARERAPLNFTTQNCGEIGVPSMLCGYTRLYSLPNFCGYRPKLRWRKLFTKNIELATNGWLKTVNFNKNFKYIENKKHTYNIEGDVVKNLELAKTLEKIASEGKNSSLYTKGGDFQKIVVEELRNNSCLTSKDLQEYKVKKRNVSKTKCFNYTIVGTDLPGSGFTFLLGCKIVEAAYETLVHDLSSEERTLFMYHILRYMYSLKPHLKKFLGNKKAKEDILNNATIIANDIFKNFDKPWDVNPIKKFGTLTLNEDIRHKEEFGTANIIIKRGKFAITMTSTINSYFGSKVPSSLGFFYNNQLKDFDDVLTPNAPLPRMIPQSATTAIIFYSKNMIPVFQIGAAGGNKMIGAIFNTFFNFWVNHMSLEEANEKPRCMPLYLDQRETIYCEKALDTKMKDKFNQLDMPVKYVTEKLGGVTASSSINGKEEAAYDIRRGGSFWINSPTIKLSYEFGDKTLR